MKWDELEEKLKDALAKETLGEAQLALVDILPSIKDDYEIFDKTGSDLVSAQSEVDRLKGVLQEEALKGLTSVTDEPEVEESELILGDDVLEEIIKIHEEDDKKEE